MKTILIAEDDIHIRTGLVDTLESEGFRTLEAANGREALELFASGRPDLVLLDVMMPEKSGYDVCQEIRTGDTRIPIIMLTAKGEEIDKVVGLKLGADDYVTKPFGIHELLARIDAVLRRAGQAAEAAAEQAADKAAGTAEAVIDFGPGRVDTKCYVWTLGQATCPLTEREIRLIRLFSARPNEVLSRDAILNEVWGIDYLGTTRTLDQHIANLRKKIEANPSSPRIIRTVHGVGYRYVPVTR